MIEDTRAEYCRKREGGIIGKVPSTGSSQPKQQNDPFENHIFSPEKVTAMASWQDKKLNGSFWRHDEIHDLFAQIINTWWPVPRDRVEKKCQQVIAELKYFNCWEKNFFSHFSTVYQMKKSLLSTLLVHAFLQDCRFKKKLFNRLSGKLFQLGSSQKRSQGTLFQQITFEKTRMNIEEDQNLQLLLHFATLHADNRKNKTDNIKLESFTKKEQLDWQVHKMKSCVALLTGWRYPRNSHKTWLQVENIEKRISRWLWKKETLTVKKIVFTFLVVLFLSVLHWSQKLINFYSTILSINRKLLNETYGENFF